MSKYEPLPRFLNSHDRGLLRLKFREIEEVLGFKLPNSAYDYEAWWSNNETGHSHARSWIRAGWRTAAIDLKARKVTFERQESDASRTRRDPFGCMAGTITLIPDVDLTAPSDEAWNAERGLLLNE